ncbi:MAG: ABC transporter ATP-binding protein [Candidatus Odinarchaeota archaeon]
MNWKRINIECYFDYLLRGSLLHVLLRLFRYISRRKKIALGILVFLLVAQLAELTIPLLTGWTIDQILNALEEQRFEFAIVLFGALIIVVSSLIRGVTAFIARYLGYILGENVIYEIRRDLFMKYENSSLSFFDKHHTGDLMARATTDLEPIAEFLVWSTRVFFQALVTFTGVYLVLLLIDVRLFLLISIVSPTLFILSYYVSRRLGPLYFDIREQYGQLTTVVQENIAGAQVVRAFNAEEREKAKFNRENLAYMNLRITAFKIRSIFLPFILFLVNLLITILVFVGGMLVIQEAINPGLLVTLFMYFAMLAMPTRFLAFSLIMYQRIKAAGERVFTLLETRDDLEEERDKPTEIFHIAERPPSIIFDSVSFTYDKKKKVLDSISLVIEPGERVALLGPTGSGKSTLVSLIPRFYDPSEGRIIIRTSTDDRDLRELSLKSWRKNIGIVHQEPFLFGRTIAENIAFGLPEVTGEQIEEVARIAQVNEFIENFEDGYGTIIGERGVTLSGGQKQRVAIARMLLREPLLMILDDATSSVDTATENAFQEAFEDFIVRSKRKSTMIFITHRLSTVKNADRIIILNKGRILEQGSHENLLQNGNVYPLLWKTQEAGMVDIKIALEKIALEIEIGRQGDNVR